MYMYTIWRKYENSIFEALKIKLNKLYVLFMHWINLTVYYLKRKYAVLLHNFLNIGQEVQATLKTGSICAIGVAVSFSEVF